MDKSNIHKIVFGAERANRNAKGEYIPHAPLSTSTARIIKTPGDNGAAFSNPIVERRDGEIGWQIASIVVGLARHLGLRIPVIGKIRSVEFSCSRILPSKDDPDFRTFFVKVTTMDGRVFSAENPLSRNQNVKECADLIATQVLANYFPELENEL